MRDERIGVSHPLLIHPSSLILHPFLLFSRLGGHAFSLLARLFDCADHVEGLFGQVVVLAVNDLLEAAYGVGDLDELAFEARELLRDEEGLREEALNLARARDYQLVLLRQFVEAEYGYDVLKVFVALQDLFDGLRRVVVILTDDARVEYARRGGERVNRRVDSEFDNLARERRDGIEVRERGRGRGVCVVVRGDVDGLNRSDRARARRGDALLQLTHLGCEVRLVADRRGHSAQKRRDFGACLREAEDVVNEEEHVETLVAEVFGDGET